MVAKEEERSLHTPCANNEVEKALDWNAQWKLSANRIEYFKFDYASHPTSITVSAPDLWHGQGRAYAPIQA